MTTTVSIRELKDRLSSYVRRIRAGEEPALTLVTWSAEKPCGGRRRPRIKGASAAEAVLEDRR